MAAVFNYEVKMNEANYNGTVTSLHPGLTVQSGQPNSRKGLDLLQV